MQGCSSWLSLVHLCPGPSPGLSDPARPVPWKPLDRLRGSGLCRQQVGRGGWGQNPRAAAVAVADGRAPCIRTCATAGAAFGISTSARQVPTRELGLSRAHRPQAPWRLPLGHVAGISAPAQGSPPGQPSYRLTMQWECFCLDRGSPGSSRLSTELLVPRTLLRPHPTPHRPLSALQGGGPSRSSTSTLCQLPECSLRCSCS